MPDFVYDIPLKDLAKYFAAVAVLAIVIGILIVKPVLRLLMGSGSNLNEAISHGTSAFSLFYGLLLGLLTVAAYQNSERVKQAILNEATAISAFYSDMNMYPEPIRSDLKDMLRDYVLFTIYKEWPAHRKGKFLDGGTNRANAVRQRLATFEPRTESQKIIHAEVINNFQNFIQARQQRLMGVITAIPDVLWYAVLVGAAINILLLVALRMPLRQQFVLGTTTAFFLGVILFVIVALDRPLRGVSGLDPGPIRLLWDRQMIWDEPLADSRSRVHG
jgi:hypothetical protein